MKSFKTWLEEMKKEAGSQLGSNPGGIHIDDSGQKHYVKFYKNPAQGHSEVAASNVYNLMRARTVNPESKEVSGKPALISKWNDSLKQIKPHEFDKMNHVDDHQLAKHYISAVLTKNWDFSGLEHDNIMRHSGTGNLHTVDTGGSFKFRAMGGHKEYDPNIKELHSLRHNSESSGHVISGMFNRHPDERAFMKPTIDHLRSISDEDFGHAIKSSGLIDHVDITHNLLKRRDALLKHYDQ